MSRTEDILQSIVDNTTYKEKPQSRVEELLIEVKDVITNSGGGGGTSTTIDTELDARSTNPVQNKAVAGAVNDVQNDISGIRADIADILDKEVPALQALVEANADNISEQETAITKVAEQAALNRISLGLQRKNLLKNDCPRKITTRGITINIQNDGGILLTGRNTDNISFIAYLNMQTGAHTGSFINQFVNNKKWFVTGDYFLSGGISDAQLHLCASETDNSEGEVFINSSGKTRVTIEDKHKYTWTRLFISASANFSDEGVIIYPMLRYAEITDDTYEPYQPSLQEQIDELRSQINALKGEDTASIEEIVESEAE